MTIKEEVSYRDCQYYKALYDNGYCTLNECLCLADVFGEYCEELEELEGE
jgi:hypothetical protein